VAPRTPTESTLAAIWADLLRIEPVGVHDNFFDLGGTSLLAVDLFAQVWRRFGREMPLTSLLEAPTVEALARLVSGEVSADSLVVIRPGDGRPPLFLVHDGDGETMLYRNLAMRLDPGHAVYGLQPYSLDGVPMAHTRIPEMAAYHIDKLRAIQPRGPYLLGGMCAGGVIAYEIARQLEAMGERVALVALLDAADPAAAPRAWRVARDRLRRFGGVFREGGADPSGRRALTILVRASRKARNTAAYVARERIGKARDEIRMRLFRAWLDRGRRLPRILGHVPLRTVYLFAEREYRPEGRFVGELTLFRATAGIGPDEPYVDRYDDPLLGWGRRAALGVRAFDVPGGHSSMLQEPHVEALADRLQSRIDEALGGEAALPPEPALASPSAGPDPGSRMVVA
jgi:thioesterase domain-containing protein